MPASLQYSLVVEGGKSTGIATHFFLIASNSGSSIRMEVKPSQSHWRPVPFTNALMVSATCSRVLFMHLTKTAEGRSARPAFAGRDGALRRPSCYGVECNP